MRPYEKLHAWYNSLDFLLDGTLVEAPPRLEPTTDLPFASDADIAQFERRTALTLPEDFREHLLHTFRDAAPFDETYWLQFWPVAHLVTLPSDTEFYRYKGELEAAHEFVHFADHFIRGRDWVINCGNGARRGQVYEILGDSIEFTCASFAEFVDIVVNDPDRLATF